MESKHLFIADTSVLKRDFEYLILVRLIFKGTFLLSTHEIVSLYTNISHKIIVCRIFARLYILDIIKLAKRNMVLEVNTWTG